MAGILEAAERHGAGLVVLCSSSPTDCPRVPLGSVATWPLHVGVQPPWRRVLGPLREGGRTSIVAS